MLFIIFSCLLAVVATFNGFDDWRINSYGNYPLLSYVGEFSSVIIIISLAQMIKTDKIKRFFELFGKNTIFLLGYHIVLPGTLAIFIKDPVQFLEKYWFIYYILAVFILYLFLKIVPENLIYLLEGRFYLLKSYSHSGIRENNIKQTKMFE
ncbi:MAG: acyltransferase [Thermosipho sp. (in: thermotogales)]|nr:acyltransferase [Thermosipho sp. (in: thermotogales)]